MERVPAVTHYTSHQRGNHFKSVAMLQDAPIAELVAITMCHLHAPGPVDSEDHRRYRLPRLRWSGAVLTTEQQRY